MIEAEVTREIERYAVWPAHSICKTFTIPSCRTAPCRSAFWKRLRPVSGGEKSRPMRRLKNCGFSHRCGPGRVLYGCPRIYTE